MPNQSEPTGPDLDAIVATAHGSVTEVDDSHPLATILERIVSTVAQVVMWANVLLVMAIITQVVLRYLFNQNYAKLDEIQWHLYGAAAMIGMSYAMIKDSHVRVDLLHGHLSRRAQRIIEVVGITILVFPFIYMMVDQGWDYFYESWRVNERSTSPTGLPARWAYKFILPASFVLLGIAAVARLIRDFNALVRRLDVPSDSGRGLRTMCMTLAGFFIVAIALMPLVDSAEHRLVIAMFMSFIALLFAGFPVAWTLAGIGVLFCGLAYLGDHGYLTFLGEEATLTGLGYLPLGLVVNRVYATMSNPVLVALPMFIFMGLMLDESGVANRLMHSMQRLFGTVHGGLAITTAAIGIILAASTGIIGASVVLLGVLSLPVMMQQGYSKALGTGTVAASGTLGILMPPSIMLVIMADQMALSVGDLFMAAIFPSLIIGGLYIVYILITGALFPKVAPVPEDAKAPDWSTLKDVATSIIPPVLLILSVLGSVFAGIATPTEASGVGAVGATLLAIANRQLTFQKLKNVCRSAFNTTAYIYAILVGATCFSYVLRELGGDELIEGVIASTGLDPTGTIIFILFIVFFLGFVLDWIEITLIVLPLMRPIVSGLGLEVNGFGVVEEPTLIWFVILVAVTLQTSFLTPPVGFALFYLKGVCPPGIKITDIYKGVIPFVLLQLLGLIIVFVFPELVTWMPAAAVD